MNDNVSLTISKDIVNPIVEAKIKEAILAAMGGKEELVEKVVASVFSKKVNKDGRISSYSSDNKYTWLDIIVTNQIEAAVKEEVQKMVKENSVHIVKAVKKQLTTSSGQSMVAKAMLAGLEGTLQHAWASKIEIKFTDSSTH